MGEEFDLFVKIADGYSVEDVLSILGITPESLYSRYLQEEILDRLGEFDV